ncbi:MAG: asparagine synthase [Bacteroidota bacterium]
MCGVNGFYRKNGSAAAALPRIRRMNRLLRHRGPDSEGAALLMSGGQGFLDLRLDETAASRLPQHMQLIAAEGNPEAIGCLGHRRLSIVDLSMNAHQPMADEQGRYRLVFNGEIFNYRELRLWLKSQGMSFFSDSDTEVLLKGWMLEGFRFLARINGFFAGCMADAHAGTWTLFRDRPGVKPLFYMNQPDFFAFSSETSPLRDCRASIELNQAQLAAFLVHGQTIINHETSWFQHIHSLKPGTALEFQCGSGKMVHHQIPEFSEAGNNNLEACLISAVRCRVAAEVPVGFAASGGLDSSLILGMAASMNPQRLQGLLAFSAVSGHAKADESPWQEQITNHTGVQRVAVKMVPQDISLLPELIAAADMPAVAWNNLAHYRICAAAHEAGIKVMLNGQGADELMAGYTAYLPAWFRIASWKQRLDFLLNLKHCGLNLSSWLRLQMREQLQRNLGAARWQQAALKRKAGVEFCSPDLLDMLPGAAAYPASPEHVLQQDFYGMKLGQMLQWEDRNSMAHSIESRNPFADDAALIQRCFTIPFREKVQHGFTKFPLRKISEAYIPAALSWRRDKKGFSMPDTDFTLQALPQLRAWVADNSIPGVDQQALLKASTPESLQRNPGLAGFVFRCATGAMFMQHVKQSQRG